MRLVISALALAVMTAPARADVVDKGPSGFTAKTTVTINASPQRAYDAFLRVGEWWDPAHTWSGSGQNLRIEPRTDGCFCETLPNGGSVRHASVVFVDPGKLVRLSGALGPLQAMAVTGSLTWTFEPSGTGTTATVTYAVSGYAAGGLEPLAAPVDAVIGGQLRRLKASVERQ